MSRKYMRKTQSRDRAMRKLIESRPLFSSAWLGVFCSQNFYLVVEFPSSFLKFALGLLAWGLLASGDMLRRVARQWVWRLVLWVPGKSFFVAIPLCLFMEYKMDHPIPHLLPWALDISWMTVMVIQRKWTVTAQDIFWQFFSRGEMCLCLFRVLRYDSCKA